MESRKTFLSDVARKVSAHSEHVHDLKAGRADQRRIMGNLAPTSLLLHLTVIALLEYYCLTIRKQPLPSAAIVGVPGPLLLLSQSTLSLSGLKIRGWPVASSLIKPATSCLAAAPGPSTRQVILVVIKGPLGIRACFSTRLGH